MTRANDPHGAHQAHRWRWFAALYAGGVGTLAVVAYGLRLLLKLLA